MADLPGYKNLRLMAQQPVAIGEMGMMRHFIGETRLERRYSLELTFESDLVVNVPLDAKLYSLILDELKRQPGVGIEQRMAARSAIASAGLEKQPVREQVLPVDATGVQVYDALLSVSGRPAHKEPNPAPALSEAEKVEAKGVEHAEFEDDTEGVFEPDDDDCHDDHD